MKPLVWNDKKSNNPKFVKVKNFSSNYFKIFPWQWNYTVATPVLHTFLYSSVYLNIRLAVSIHVIAAHCEENFLAN